MALPNVRDEQAIRETVLTGSPQVLDKQVLREAILGGNPFVRSEQVFREVIMLVGTSGSKAPVVFVVV